MKRNRWNLLLIKNMDEKPEKSSWVEERAGRLFPLLLFILTLLLTTNLTAQESSLITIDQAIQIALKENIDLKQYANSVSISEIEVKQAKADFLPNITASVSAAKNYQKEASSEVGGSTNSSGSINATASSSLNLFNGFSDAANLQRTKLEFAADTALFSRQQESIIFETISRFLQVILDKEFIRIEKENLQAQRQQLKQVEEFQKAGNRSLADVLQQQAEIKQAEQGVIAAERNYEVSRLSLLQTLGKSPGEDYHFAPLPINHLISSIQDKDNQQIAENALTTRTDILAQKNLIEASNKQVWASRSGYWPSISLSATAGSNYRNSNNLAGFSDQFLDTNPYATLGLSISIPIFDRFQTKNNVQRATLQLKNQKLDFENLKLEVGFEVQQSMLDYQTALKQRDVAQAQYEYTDEALQIIETRYSVGSATFVELSQVRAQHLNAVYDTVSADYNLLLQWFSVSFYSGTIEQSIAVLTQMENLK